MSSNKANLAPTAVLNEVLSKTIAGTTVLPDAKCEFNYHWDFEENRGIAHLLTVDGADVNIVLHPLGIEGYLDFMSDIPPTQYKIGGKYVVIYRVILDINRETGEVGAAIMFNHDGSTIQTTENGLNSEDHLK